MAKSLGNFYTLGDLKEKGFSAMEVRYVLISAHYRKQLNFTLDSLAGAREALGKLSRAAQALAERAGEGHVLGEVDFGPFQSAWDALQDDMNTPAALGGIFTGMRDAASLEAQDAAKALAGLNRILRALGLRLPDPEAAADVPEEILALAEKRWEARSAKDWATSDALRDELAAKGWVVKDGREGYELNPA